MKALLALLFAVTLVLFCCSPPSEEGITGLWKTRDQNSNKPRSLVAIYEYHGLYYGRMLATYDDNGNIKDTILDPKERATGVVGNPPYCGMDFVYNLKEETDGDKESAKYFGKIIDPEQGKVYNVEVWRKGADLIVRGKLWIFGKNILWSRASKKDLPKGFSANKIKDFVPVVPEAL